MATLEELVVSLVADSAQLRAEMKSAAQATQQATAKMEDAIQTFTDNSSKQMSFWQTAVATATGFLGSEAVTKALELFKEGLEFIKDELIKGVTASGAQEQAFVQLANAMALNGQYTKNGQKALEDFIATQQRQTGISDTVIASNLALLASMTKLSADGLMNAQKAAINLAASFRIDLDTATRLVGKGIEGNTDVFKRYGLTVQQGGSATQNLANIMKALSGESGAAAAAMLTYDGRVKGINVSYEDFLKSLGSAVTQNAAVAAAQVEVKNILDEMTDSTKGSNLAFQQFVGGALVDLLKISAGIVTGLDAIGRGFGAVADIGETAFTGLEAAAAGFLSLFSSSFDEAFKGATMHLDELSKQASERFSGDTFLGGAATALLKVADAAEGGMQRLTAAGSEATKATVAQGQAVHLLTEEEKAHQEVVKSFIQGLADQTTAIDANYQIQADKDKENFDLKLTSQADYDAERTAALIAQQELENMTLEDARKQDLVSNTKYLEAKKALDAKHEKDSTELKIAQNKTREQNLKDTFSNIATLSTSSNKELATIGKAAAIATATIDGYAAVQKALASAPPPFNFALAALVGAATAANVAKIAGVGLNEGGTVPGGNGTPNRDSVNASLTPGELVVDRSTHDKLEQFLDGQGGGGSMVVEISLKDGLMDFIEAQLIERKRNGTSTLKITG